MTTYLTYIGTYTRREAHVDGSNSEGIYIYRFDDTDGSLSHVSTVSGVDNPSFLALDPQQNYLYAANEVGDFGGASSGAVSAFAIDADTGGLTFLNQQATGGSFPCHLSVDKQGRHVLAANYGGGSVALFPVNPDGSLAEASDFHQHQGSSVNPQRQQEPHAHSVTVAPDNRFAFVADLGMDQMVSYQIDPDNHKLVPTEPPWKTARPGSGPRHFDFHPNGQYAYLINELDSTLTAFNYNADQGTLTEIQTLSTLPADFSGSSHCADVHVAASGNFVYGSNRGHDSIAIFAINPGTGRVTPVGHTSTQGETPRNFALSPNGDYLLAANQNTSNIATYHVDQATGELTPTGHNVQVPTPVCIKFLV